ncbi:hypothetical protein [Streptosporangium sp. OZ121]|uniref:hypothetical protein n=1 Tax=Streptosporangium sp. OZ121 TaxID=3444183 RepID=UPI003F7931FB
MSTRMTTKVSMSRKLLVTLLLIPLVILVTAENPKDIGVLVGNIITLGGQFLYACADFVSRVVRELTSSSGV